VLDRNDPTKVVIVGATSAPWLVNPVLRGEGRFDHSMLVGPADAEAREAALERLVRTRMLPVEASIEALAGRTEGCTTDDLNALFSAAAELAFRDAAERGTLGALSDRHFDMALGRIRRSANEWFDTAYNFPEFTDDTSEFDPLFDYIRRNVRRI
jgi:SpoVK/Ycf46/Vps4 family AAA+-type ATPase